MLRTVEESRFKSQQTPYNVGGSTVASLRAFRKLEVSYVDERGYCAGGLATSEASLHQTSLLQDSGKCR